jgi:hypothetical protein
MMHLQWFEKLVPIVTAAVCAAVVSVPAWAESAFDQRAAITARRLRGGGEWQNATARQAVRQWDLDMTRADDDSLSGSVTLVGSPLMQRGRLRGTIEGRRVSGSVTDEAGNHVATFVGAVTSDGGLQGTYQDRTGEVGRWSWHGQLPR